MPLFDAALLDRLSAAARSNPRLRQNHNLHASPDDPVQRFFNAIEPGSYVVPHQHLGKDETLVMLRGQLGLILFEDDGRVLGTHRISCGGFHLGPGTWHSVVALESGTVFFETKAGPYQPLSPEERASWAPPENTPAAGAFQSTLLSLFEP